MPEPTQRVVVNATPIIALALIDQGVYLERLEHRVEAIQHNYDSTTK